MTDPLGDLEGWRPTGLDPTARIVVRAQDGDPHFTVHPDRRVVEHWRPPVDNAAASLQAFVDRYLDPLTDWQRDYLDAVLEQHPDRRIIVHAPRQQGRQVLRRILTELAIARLFDVPLHLIDPALAREGRTVRTAYRRRRLARRRRKNR